MNYDQFRENEIPTKFLWGEMGLDNEIFEAKENFSRSIIYKFN